MGATNSKTRFSDRVEDYILYRPEYPKELLDFLKSKMGLTPQHKIADIGSGTGKLAKLFFENGNPIYCVEPNKEMREGAEKLFSKTPGFHSIKGSAEDTTLPDHSMDFVTCGQAFHWFDPLKARQEFDRILKSPGWVCLIWNIRNNTSQHMQDYENLLRKYGTDYAEIGLGIERAKPVTTFFGETKFERFKCPHVQIFDFESLKGNLNSASYAPKAGTPAYEPMMHALKEYFDRHQKKEQLHFDYDTEMFYGRIA